MTSCHQEKSEKLNIAVAANMQFAIKELAKKFTDQTTIECDLIISSSGKLTAQIIEGAPFDVFVSADMKYPMALYNNALTESQPRIYAYGKLVLWSMVESISSSINLLEKKEINHIALANPKTAPYGSATIEVLKHFDIYDEIKNKLVFGESVAQVNQFVISRAAEIGFTAKSVLLSSELKDKGNWIDLDATTYSPIEQGVVILKNTTHPKEAKQFYDFLFSKEGKEILKDFGYDVNKN